jgi:hypothetical protein
VNKIYSKVWNKALGQLVVASELAGNKGSMTPGGYAGARVSADPGRMEW